MAVKKFFEESLKTVILYETENKYRLHILNGFALLRVRVLCLEFLQQTVKKALALHPHAIICHNTGNDELVFQTLRDLKNNAATRDIPFYIWGNPTPLLREKYMSSGVSGILPRHLKPKEIYNRIMSSPANNTVMSGEAKAQIIPKLTETIDGFNYLHVKIFSDGKGTEWKLLRDFLKEPFDVSCSNLLLDFFAISKFSNEAMSTLYSCFAKCEEECVKMSVISQKSDLDQQVKKVYPDTKFSVFSSFPEFEASLLGNEEVEIETDDKIEQDLDDLLDSILGD